MKINNKSVHIIEGPVNLNELLGPSEVIGFDIETVGYSNYEAWQALALLDESLLIATEKKDKDAIREIKKEITKYKRLSVKGKEALDPNTAYVGAMQFSTLTDIYIIRPEWVDLNELQEVFNTRQVIIQNNKFEKKFMKVRYDIEIPFHHVHDTLIWEYGLYNGRYKGKGLGDQLKRYFDVDTPKGKKHAVKNWLGEWDEEMIRYMATDVAYLHDIRDLQRAELRRFMTKWPEIDLQYIIQLEHAVTDPVIEMELTGIEVDVDYTKQLVGRYAKSQAALYSKCQQLAGNESFNPLSPAQVNELFNTDKCDEAVLTAIGTPLARCILRTRQITKFVSTYIRAFTRCAVKGRVHTNLNCWRAETGRLTSSDPNLQNIPADGWKGKVCRNLFKEAAGWHLVGADYSALEMRVLADVAGDMTLIEAFKHGWDVHVAVACLVFNMAKEAVTKQIRSDTKAVNYGIAYGKTEHGLAGDQGWSLAKARYILTSYFLAMQPIKYWIITQHNFCRRNLFVHTVGGRIRWIENINSKLRGLRSHCERQAQNTPIQGNGADGMKLAMVMMYWAIRKEGLEAFIQLVLTIHDEMLARAKEGYQARCRELLQYCMITAQCQFVGQVKIDVGNEDNGWQAMVLERWGDMK